MIKSIIVDDEEATRALLRNYVEKTDFLELVGECSDGIEAANEIRKKDVDVVFLDIEMPGMDGIELMDSLLVVPQIILVTSKDNYAVKAFEYNVTDYLLKPVQYGRFLKAAQRVYDHLEVRSQSAKASQDPDQSEAPPVKEEKEEEQESSKSNEAIFIKIKSQLVKIYIKDILWVEAQGDYVKIVTDDKSYTINSTMKHISKKLPQDQFQRAHRSYIVNTHRIKLVDEGMLVINDRLIPMGKKYQKELMKKLNMLK